MMKDKKILLLMPYFFEYPRLLKQELEKKGAIVYSYDERPSSNAFYRSLVRLGLDFFVKKHRDSYFNKIINENIDIDIDIILVVAPEHCGYDFFNKLKNNFKSSRIVIYLWDSMRNRKIDKNVIKLADKIYSFDPDDCDKYKFEFLPLFFSAKNNTAIKDIELLFIGTVHSRREKIVSFCKEYFSSSYIYYYVPSFIFFFFKKLVKKETRLRIKDVSVIPVSYDSYMDLMRKSKFVIDVSHERQVGLTMRTFEALSSSTKIITTNKDIINYDFYLYENIFILDESDFDIGLFNDFISSPYKDIEKEILNKYSLSSWLDNVLS